MAISVTLRVSGIDLDDATVGHTLATQLPLLLWQGDQTHATATFDVDEQDAVTQTFDVARQLETIAPGVKILGTDRDLVSTTEIASRVGVSREGARKWTKEPEFPAPHAVIGNRMAVWSWASVVEWLLASRAIDMDETLPSEQLLTQIDNVIFRNPDATTMQWNLLPAGPGGTRTRQAIRFTSTFRAAAWTSVTQHRGTSGRSGSTTVSQNGKHIAWHR